MQAFYNSVLYHADEFLIGFYRLTGHPFLDYLLGTISLALLCVVVGEVTVSLAIRYNQRYIDEMAQEMDQKEKMSMAAYHAGDKPGYKALNQQATDAWGKHFFTMVGYSAGMLWPIPFALGWMQTRFYGVDFDLAFPLSLLFGKTVGYLFTFIPLYILARIVFKYMRPYLPYFRGVQKRLDHCASRDAS